MTASDDMTATETTPETPETDPEATPETPKALNMDKVEAATDAHVEAVTTAHENLGTRMAAAYAEFSNDLDRAYTVWENAVKDAKSVTEIFSHSEVSNAGHADPTTAR